MLKMVVLCETVCFESLCGTFATHAVHDAHAQIRTEKGHVFLIEQVNVDDHKILQRLISRFASLTSKEIATL